MKRAFAFRLPILLPLLVLSLIFFACDAAEEPAAVEAPAETELESTAAPEPDVPADDSRFFVEVDLGDPPPPVDVDMPAEYLDVPMEFSPVPDYGIPSGETAIVASDRAMFWPGMDTVTAAGLETLGPAERIPVGTVLGIGDAVKDAESEWSGLFEFQNDWNWFYPTEFDGVNGLVWGADLTGFDLGPDEMNHLAWLYNRPERSEAFHPLNGYRAIPEDIQTALAEDHVAFEKVEPGEYRLDMAYPDDLVSLYRSAANDRAQTLFLSTDIFIHSLHLVFDRFLSGTEEEFFFPRLVGLTEVFRDHVGNLRSADDGGSPRYTETLELAQTYFDVASMLLALAPEKVEGNYPGEFHWEEKDTEGLIASYPEKARAEVDFIMGAGGFAESPNFSYVEDYSQYKPRGHYTKNGILESYFRAMMWYGRLHFAMQGSDTANITDEQAEDLGQYPAVDGDVTARSGDETARLLAPVALVINRIAMDDDAVMAAWRELFDPVTYLVGVSDDLNFDDIVPVMDLPDWNDFPVWVSDDANLDAFLNEAGGKLRGPRISGNSLFLGPSEDHEEPLPGFRLFGQRFTFDSLVHQMLSAPRLMNGSEAREMVSGLDVMAVLGSRTADALLESEYQRFPEKMEQRVDAMAAYAAEGDPEFWDATFYSRYLGLVGRLASFEQGAGFYFTSKPAWNAKALLSSHAAWAELRHDTILYVKQVYAEMAGGDDMEPTYRTVPYPRPIHYIEPNLGFFLDLEGLLTDMIRTLGGQDYFTPDWREKYVSLLDVVRSSRAVVEKEVVDAPISPEMNEFIVGVPKVLSRIVVPPDVSPASYTEDNDDLKMALVADVFTNAGGGVVLEVATGIPHRMHVALVDGHGGRRIATAYAFSYYEFAQPMGHRLNDEEWKAKAYDPGADLEEYMPAWSPELH